MILIRRFIRLNDTNCTGMDSLFDAIDKAFPEVLVEKVDVDDPKNAGLVGCLHITSVPHTIIFFDNFEVSRIDGVKTQKEVSDVVGKKPLYPHLFNPYKKGARKPWQL